MPTPSPFLAVSQFYQTRQCLSFERFFRYRRLRYPRHPICWNRVWISQCYALVTHTMNAEFAKECWCIPSAVFPALSQTAEESCNMPCKGDITFKCGSGYRLSVYRYGATSSLPVNPSSDGYTNQGCYRDSSTSRVLNNRMDVATSSFTPQACTTACLTAGYRKSIFHDDGYKAKNYDFSVCWCRMYDDTSL